MSDQKSTQAAGEFLPQVRPQSGGMIEVAQSRQAQEVQAAIVVAKRFPRDTVAAFDKIIQSCRRTSLAEVAIYEYPRGGTKISGPSIRLAEAMAQSWGNLDFGIVELERREGESTAMAYAWDLETNTRQTKIFTVRHLRDRRADKGGQQVLTDERDIYEIVANQGARRLRACVLGIIPGDIQDAAVAECEKTLSGKNAKPLADRIRDMVAAFSAIGVRQEEIDAFLTFPVASATERDIAKLAKVYNSLRDGMSKKEDWFRAQPSKPVPRVVEATVTESEPAVDPEDNLNMGDEPPDAEPVSGAPVYAELLAAWESHGETAESLVAVLRGMRVLTSEDGLSKLDEKHCQAFLNNIEPFLARAKAKREKKADKPGKQEVML